MNKPTYSLDKVANLIKEMMEDHQARIDQARVEAARVEKAQVGDAPFSQRKKLCQIDRDMQDEILRGIVFFKAEMEKNDNPSEDNNRAFSVVEDVCQALGETEKVLKNCGL